MVLAGLFACSGNSTSNPTAKTGVLRVKVVDGNYLVPNTTVVLGDSTGAMISSGSTDSNGEYTFSNISANATVTAASICHDVISGITLTYYSLDIRYDVNVPAITLQATCSASHTVLGTMTVNVTNSLSGVWPNRIMFGKQSIDSPLITQQTYTVYKDDLQADGKLSIVVTAGNAYEEMKGYGTLLDQVFTEGMTVDIDVDQLMSYIQYTFLNIPAAAKNIGGMISFGRKGQPIQTQVAEYISSGQSSTTINVPYIPGFRDTVDYIAVYSPEVVLGNNNYSIGTVNQFIGHKGVTSTVPSNQSFDFSAMPVIPSNITVSTATGTATPTISWSGVDPNAAEIWGSALISSQNGPLVLSFKALPTRTSILFPELPDSLVALRPIGVINEIEINNDTDDLYTGYDDVLTKEDQFFGGTWAFPSSGYTDMYSQGAYLNFYACAPALNKACGSI